MSEANMAPFHFVIHFPVYIRELQAEIIAILNESHLNTFFMSTWPLLLIGILIGLGIQFYVTKTTKNTLDQNTDFITTIKRKARPYLLPLSLSLTYTATDVLNDTDDIHVPLLLSILWSAFWVIDVLFGSENAIGVVARLTRAQQTWLRVISKLLAFTCVIYGFTTSLHEMPYLYQFLRHISLLLGSLLIPLCTMLLLNLAPTRFKTGQLTLVVCAIMLTGLFAMFTDQSTLAHRIFTGSLGLLVILTLWAVLGSSVRQAANVLKNPDHPWHHQLNRQLKLDHDDIAASVPWIGFFAQLGLLCTALYSSLWVWGVSDQSLEWVRTRFFQGFEIGEFRFVPIKMTLGLVVFVVLFNIARGVSRRIGNGKFIPNTLEPSVVETFAKICLYVGFIIASFVGLTLSGFNFQSLAIVAGALSVGIGFGLQNIVNNFVSGIILLFERPVRRGDWITVGGTEGFVENIRVRSTEIRTWDREHVIIPNSDFISQQVTNFTLRDPYGRVIVPVGVAYGSDTALVKSILEAVAQDHPKVLSSPIHSQIPTPQVIFRQFGDSSLNFELRCFIRNITDRIQVISDMNFEIDRRFREHKVEIPFPQRDLHLRSSVPVPFADQESISRSTQTGQ